jgi:hypothetical protein
LVGAPCFLMGDLGAITTNYNYACVCKVLQSTVSLASSQHACHAVKGRTKGAYGDIAHGIAPIRVSDQWYNDL